MTGPEISPDLANRLIKAAKQAREIPFRAVWLSNGEPQPNKCHANVCAFIKENPGYRPIRGWLHAGAQIERHSIVEGADGQFDITPLRTATPFFVHPGSDAEFFSLPAIYPW